MFEQLLLLSVFCSGRISVTAFSIAKPEKGVINNNIKNSFIEISSA